MKYNWRECEDENVLKKDCNQNTRITNEGVNILQKMSQS